MVATKRASIKSPTRAAKAAKTSAPKDFFAEDCDAVLTMLDADESLNEESRGLLRAAAPFALKMPRTERHRFQESAIEKLSEIFIGVQEKRGAALKEREAAAAEAREKQCTLDRDLDTAKQAQAVALEARDAAKKAMEDGASGVSNMKKALADAKAKADGVKAQSKQSTGEKEEREQFITESWAKLKGGSFTGKEWRVKAKAIENVVALLETLGVEPSLVVAIPIALKGKPEDRGFVAGKAVEAADRALHQSVSTLEDNIAQYSVEEASQAKSIATAEEALSAAMKEQGEKEDAYIAAENVLAKATEAADEASAALQGFMDSTESCRAELTSAQDSLNVVFAHLARFDALVEGGAAASQPKEETVVAETVATCNEDDAKVDEPMPVA